MINIRLSIGRLFGWDGEPGASTRESFATRLTAADHSRSLVPPGTKEGLFYAKTPAGFKISKIPHRRVTCYLVEFKRRTQLSRSIRIHFRDIPGFFHDRHGAPTAHPVIPLALIRTYTSVTVKNPNDGPGRIGYKKSTGNQEAQRSSRDKIRA
jgi:hypothetical protein